MALPPLENSPPPPPPPPPPPASGGNAPLGPMDLKKAAAEIDTHKMTLNDNVASNDQEAMKKMDAIDKDLAKEQAAEEAKGNSGDAKRLDAIDAMRADIAATKKAVAERSNT